MDSWNQGVTWITQTYLADGCKNLCMFSTLPMINHSVVWCCWLCNGKSIRPVKSPEPTVILSSFMWV